MIKYQMGISTNNEGREMEMACQQNVLDSVCLSGWLVGLGETLTKDRDLKTWSPAVYCSPKAQGF